MSRRSTATQKAYEFAESEVTSLKASLVDAFTAGYQAGLDKAGEMVNKALNRGDKQ